jgi:regulator of replication initiation timing
MKRAISIIALFLILVLASSIYCFREAAADIKSLSKDIGGYQKQITGIPSQVEKISRSSAVEPLIEQIKALTRENEQLRMENLDLVTQLEEFGHWWKGGRQEPEIPEEDINVYAGKDYEAVERYGNILYKDRY